MFKPNCTIIDDVVYGMPTIWLELEDGTKLKIEKSLDDEPVHRMKGAVLITYTNGRGMIDKEIVIHTAGALFDYLQDLTV